LKTPQPIMLATSAVGGAIAVGSVYLRCGEKVIKLPEVYCDPQASHNLLSMSAVVRAGMSFQTSETGEPVSCTCCQANFCEIRPCGWSVLPLWCSCHSLILRVAHYCQNSGFDSQSVLCLSCEDVTSRRSEFCGTRGWLILALNILTN
jgi:hypothetical protein